MLTNQFAYNSHVRSHLFWESMVSHVRHQLMQPGKESNAPKNEKQTLATKIYAAQRELNLESRVVMKKKSRMQKEIKKMEGKNENPNNPTVEAARQLRGEQ